MGYSNHTSSFSRINIDKLRVWNISDPVLFDKDNIIRISINIADYSMYPPVGSPVIYIYTLNSSGQKQEISCTPDAGDGQFKITLEDLPKIKGLYHSLFLNMKAI